MYSGQPGLKGSYLVNFGKDLLIRSRKKKVNKKKLVAFTGFIIINYTHLSTMATTNNS